MFEPFPLGCLKNAKENLRKIIDGNLAEAARLASMKDKSYLGFMRPFMELEQRINEFFTPIAHLNSVCDSPESREAFSSCLPALSEYSTNMSQNKALYDAVLEISRQNGLTAPQKKVLDDHITAFRLGGVHLPEDKKSRIKEINRRLSELSDTFGKNLLDATNAYELILKDDLSIKRMPESDKAAAKIGEGWRFTLQAPSYTAFMTYCDDRALREKTYRAYMTRAENNGPVIEEILKLRQEKAEILGFKNYAELNNQTMSCPSARAALDFLNNLSLKGRPYAEKELEEMKEFAKAKGLSTVESYDTAYLSNLIKVEKLKFDEEAYRPYFEKERVVNGLFEFLHNLFGIDFSMVKDTPLWHETVRCYDLSDSKGGVFARLYLDLEARPEKRGGAWMNNWHTARTDDKGVKRLPTAFIAANFPPSTADGPSFLRHDDVNTLFHEAGHAIHHLMSKVEEADVSGINGVEWDAVEFPSQFLENFSYEPGVLSLFARHYDTGEPISDEMTEMLVKNRNFQSGMFLVRQLEFSIFDMLIHEKACTAEEVRAILQETRKKTAVITLPDYARFENGFSHIFGGGYAAGYYSYKWAEMLSADAYLAFSKAGVFDGQLAASFMENILSKGGSAKMSELFELFMGRKPEEDRLLELLGIL